MSYISGQSEPPKRRPTQLLKNPPFSILELILMLNISVKELLCKIMIIILDLMSCRSNKPKIAIDIGLSFKKENYIKMELFVKNQVPESSQPGRGLVKETKEMLDFDMKVGKKIVHEHRGSFRQSTLHAHNTPEEALSAQSKRYKQTR